VNREVMTIADQVLKGEDRKPQRWRDLFKILTELGMGKDLEDRIIKIVQLRVIMGRDPRRVASDSEARTKTS